ncbi:MAG: hypothetical protein AAGU11_23580, partial [Syntrophobacteraceae bacterium]
MQVPRKLDAILALASVLAVLAIAVPGYGAQPPIEQPLIREGDFAVELARSLNLASTDDETRAESSLATAGIAPRNGWMADYPVTPDIISEIQDSTKQAAKSRRIAMDEGAAVRTVQRVLYDLGLPITVAGARKNFGHSATAGDSYESSNSGRETASPYASDSYADESAPPGYDDSQDVDTYYYEYGPPVVSYYVPPWDYAYMYSWVPWPFWWGNSWFGGYFVLNSFDIFIGRHHWRHRGHHHGHKRDHRVSNRSRDVNGRAARIDPANRLANVRGAGRTGTRLAAVGSSDFQRSGRSIVNREAARGSRNNAGRSVAPNGAGSNMASKRSAGGDRSRINATGRPANTALNRPSTGRGVNNSGSVGRNSGRTSPDYNAPRTSAYAARGARSSGFQGRGSSSGRGVG